MKRLLVLLVLSCLAFPQAADARRGDIYQCTSSLYLKISKNGQVTNESNETFRFSWGGKILNITGPKVISQFETKFEIKFQNETFVSAGGTTWGIIQFNEKTNTLMILAPRLDGGMAIRSKCRRL